MKSKKRILTVALATCLTIGSSLPAMAQVTSYVTEKSGVKYEYKMSDLIASIEDQAFGGEGKLIKQYLAEDLVAVYDDVKKAYISKAEVMSAIEDAAFEGAQFDLNKFTEAAGTPTTSLEDVKNVDKDGNITDAPPVQGDLKVESVSAITETGVDVTFAALAGDITGATVVVKNSKGETVAVKTANLKKDDKVASFDFVTNVAASDLTGVWTVDGVEFSFNEKALVDEILKAVGGTSDVLVLEALNNAKIKNINEDLAAGYKNAINEVTPEPTSLVEIQKIVDTENTKYGKVKAVIDASMSLMGEEVKVFNALKSGFENIESSWSEAYLLANVKLADGSAVTIQGLGPAHFTGVTAVTYEELQKAVDRVAIDEIKKLVTGANGLYSAEPKASDVAEAKALITKYAKLAYQVEDEVTLGDYLADKITQMELIMNVDKATTKAAVKSALVRLGDFDASLATKYEGVTTVNGIVPTNNFLSVAPVPVDADFNVDAYDVAIKADNGFGINDANLDEYIKAIKASTWALKDSVAKIATIIENTNNAQGKSLVEDLRDAANDYDGDSSKRPEYLKALQAVGAKRIDTNNFTIYADTIDASNGIVTAFKGLTVPATNLVETQNIVDAANIYVVSKLATDNRSTELVNALKVLDIKDLKIDAANRTEYLKNIQTIPLGAFDASSVATDLTAIETAVKLSNTEADTAAALKAFNEATTVSAAKTALDNLSAVTPLTAYASTPAGDKEFVAGELLESRNKMVTGRNVLPTGQVQTEQKAKQFRTVGELVHYLTTDVSEVAAGIDFNGDNNKTNTNNSTKGDTLINPIGSRVALIDAVNAVDSNVATTSGAIGYTRFLTVTAQTFKDAKVPGFTKGTDPVSSADIALVEKYFNSAAFYTQAEVNASPATLTLGDLKRAFNTVSEILQYMK